MDAMAAAEPPPICVQIRRARKGAGLSQEEAARRLHLSLGAYTAYEKHREPKPSRLREIAKVFGLDENYFGTQARPDDDQLVALREELAEARGEWAGLNQQIESLRVELAKQQRAAARKRRPA